MSTTEPTEPMTRKQIRAALDELAPYPKPGEPATARAIAKRLAVDAQRHWRRFLLADGPADIGAIRVLNAEFAVVHLLVDLIAGDPQKADELAAEICDAWNDGGGVGEWLWEHEEALGVDPAEVNRLEEAWQALENAKGEPAR